MNVEAKLGDYINSFEYVQNCHYICLTDKDGNKLKLLPTGLIQGQCDGCNETIYVTSNHGKLKCPFCGGYMKWKWGNLQLCFVPEEPSDFKPPPQRNKK